MSLTFKPQSYLRPTNEADLSEMLAKHGERARIIAGGTGIYEVAHRGLFSDVETLIDISGLNISYISRSDKFLRIGACRTMSQLKESSEICNRVQFSGILDALTAIQPIQVKNVATVGGAICTALPFFDLPVSLLSLNARVCVGPTGKVKPLSEFLQGYFSVALEPGEFVREIEIPFDNTSRSAFQKFALTHDDWALINCGVSLSFDPSKRVTKACVIFGGGVGDKPVRAFEVEKGLIGLGVDAGEQEIKKQIIGGLKREKVECVSDIRASSEYRERLVSVLGERTVLSAYERARIVS